MRNDVKLVKSKSIRVPASIVKVIERLHKIYLGTTDPCPASLSGESEIFYPIKIVRNNRQHFITHVIISKVVELRQLKTYCLNKNADNEYTFINKF